MKRNIITVLVVALSLVLGFAIIASADTGARNDFNTQYPGNTFGGSCSICHTSAPALNPYGADLLANGATASNIPAATFVAVEGLDSDGDGFKNLVEITHNPSTFPGDPNSHPVVTVPVVTITATDNTATETGPTTGTFTVSRTGSTSEALTVYYGVSRTATSGSDYTALSGSVTIGAGSSNGTITVTPINDATVESDETVVVTLSADAAYAVGSPSSATVTIISDDSALMVIITAPNGGEVIEAGSTPIPITYGYDSTKVSSVKVKYSIDGGLTWLPAADAGGSVLGTFQWSVPTLVKNTTKARVKVIGYNLQNVKVGANKSDAPFTIEVVSITAPIADEIVTKGSVSPVTWTWIVNGTKGPVNSAKVFYTYGSSGVWKPADGTVVLDTVLGNGTLSWNVPIPAKAKIVKLKVVLKDALGVNVGKAVSKAFIVQ